MFLYSNPPFKHPTFRLIHEYRQNYKHIKQNVTAAYYKQANIMLPKYIGLMFKNARSISLLIATNSLTSVI